MNKKDEATVAAINKVTRLIKLAQAHYAANLLFALDDVTIPVHNARKVLHAYMYDEFYKLQSEIVDALVAEILGKEKDPVG